MPTDSDWNAIEADHRFLCHSDGSPCPDGCDAAPDPRRLAKYLARPDSEQDADMSKVRR